MNRTSIEWTTFSANPLKYRDAAGNVVWACVHASEGCRNCYSEALAKRYGRGGPFAAQAMKGLAPFLDEVELRHMLTAKRIGGEPVSGGRCFVGDMTDLFGEWVPDELLDRLFAAFALRPDVTFQVLTKRADRMLAWFSERWQPGREHTIEVEGHRIDIPAETRGEDRHDQVLRAAENILSGPLGDQDRFWTKDERHLSHAQPWPLPNVWLGVSVEDQATADRRIPLLLQTPAAVRFVSYEPALAPVDFRMWLGGGDGRGRGTRSGGIGRAGDRQRGPDLALGSATRGPLEGRNAVDPMRSTARGEQDQPGLHAGPRDGEREASPRAGSPSGVSALQGFDPARDDGQPRERTPLGQPAGESHARHGFGAEAALHPSPGLPPGEEPAHLSWVIVGGESGPGARPFDVAWARSTVEQCKAAGVAVFVKQLGARPFFVGGTARGCEWCFDNPEPGCPRCTMFLKSPKGGDPSEWPEDLCVREMPA